MKPNYAIFYKKICIRYCLLLLLCSSSILVSAKRKVNPNYFTGYYGFYTISGLTPTQQVDLIYSFKNRYKRGRRLVHFGLGVNYAFANEMSELGFVINSNVFSKLISINRTLMFYPIVYGQVAHKTMNTETFTNSDFNGRVGLGLIGNQMLNPRTSIRTSLKVGYVISDDYIPNQSGFTFELKIGFGIHGFKRQKKSSDG